MLKSLLLAAFCTVLAVSLEPDWLRGAVPERAPVVTTVTGLNTLTLRNGLISRTFALPSATPPPPPVSKCPAWCTIAECRSSVAECCHNPGGKVHHRPNPGEAYPYYGLPCGTKGDCGVCSADGTCVCAARDSASHKCCLPKADVPPPPPPVPPSNVPAGFATIGLSRGGYTGRECDGGAELLCATAPEATVGLDDVTYNVGGLAGQTEFAFLNASRRTRHRADPGAFGTWATGSARRRSGSSGPRARGTQTRRSRGRRKG